jgi:PilZ domain
MVPLFAQSLVELKPYLPVIIGGGVSCVVLTILAIRFAPIGKRRRQSSDLKKQEMWSPPEGAGADRRMKPRREGQPVPVYLSSAGLQSQSTAAFVIDRSSGGLKIVSAKPIPTGSTVQVLAENAPDNIPWTTVVVRSSRESGNGHELGCEFEKTPPWNVLLLFG